jgi:hypothetical protein
MTPYLHLYSFFHLNLTYSSIEEDQHSQVINTCYWPLLHLADTYKLPIGIEASGHTLETINKLDPQWISRLRELCRQGVVEFIGSGYAQIIGPLTPPRLNTANLRIGNATYEHLLGFCPKIALVNEQAVSAGLIQHYLDTGYQGMIMEWNNPARFHPEWNQKWAYLPQLATNQRGDEIPLVWNNSISFQKFQRYAHGGIELNEYITYINQHASKEKRIFTLYGNDAEIFDFRPGRFNTEARIHKDGEWNRINKLFDFLATEKRFRLVTVNSCLDLLSKPHAGNRISLETPEQPIPVKKQEKYNLTRWAVTGLHDLKINTTCWEIYKNLYNKDKEISDCDIKELCYLWSSDFRTHITQKRLNVYLRRLNLLQKKYNRKTQAPAVTQKYEQMAEDNTAIVAIHDSGNDQFFLTTQTSPFKVLLSNSFIYVESDHTKLTLNCRKGLAIQSLCFKDVSSTPLLGTLPHGYYDSISMGADFYSGHLIFEIPGKPKITDLEMVTPTIDESIPGAIAISGNIDTPLGEIEKRILIGRNLDNSPFVKISFGLKWKKIPIGSLRLGATTLNPEAFDPGTLFYATHNGGYDLEKFYLNNRSVNHGTPASFLVSASHGLGVTSGVVILGDRHIQIHQNIRKEKCAAIGLVTHRATPPSFFTRHIFSLKEMDETSDRGISNNRTRHVQNFEYTITAQKKSD